MQQRGREGRLRLVSESAELGSNGEAMYSCSSL